MNRRMVFSGGLMLTLGLAAAGLVATPAEAVPHRPSGKATPIVAEAAGPPGPTQPAPSAFPVVASPNTCGWVTCTYYFGRRATRDIARAPIVSGAVCALVAAASANPTLGAGCAVYFAAIHYQAMRAIDRRGHFLKIKYPRAPVGPPVLVPQIYSGKRCR